MKLYVMQAAMWVDGSIRAPFPAYLIQTDDGHNVLVDTGVNDQYVAQTVNERGVHTVVRPEEEKILNQLHRLGLEAADIDYVICTHLDEDHCGGNAFFDHAEFIIQRSHYELARSGREQRFEICRAYWDVPGLNYRLITGDLELLPGIKIIVTDGHVPGHQSVLVRLPNTGSVLLPNDAIRDGEMLKPGVDPRAVSMFDMDGDKLIEGINKLQGIVEREKVQMIVFGHDGRAWPSLRLAPAYYD